MVFERWFCGPVDVGGGEPREVVGRVVEDNAGSVCVAHSHRYGVAGPSQAGRGVTGRLRRGLGLIDGRILDQLVIGDGHWESFSRRGWV